MVVASISDGVHSGRGECVPYARYGESVEGVVAAIEACAQRVADGLSRAELARSAAARRRAQCARLRPVGSRGQAGGRSARVRLAGLDALAPVLTAFTLSLATPEAMAARAREAGAYPLLKLKLGGDGDASGSPPCARPRHRRGSSPMPTRPGDLRRWSTCSSRGHGPASS